MKLVLRCAILLCALLSWLNPQLSLAMQNIPDTLRFDVLSVSPPIAPGSDPIINVQFNLTIDTLEEGNGTHPILKEHYKAFISYGDGTYEYATIYDTLPAAPHTSVANDKVTYNFYHSYASKPTKPVYVSLAKMKTTDDTPPPKIIGPDIPAWLNQQGPQPTQARQSLVDSLKLLTETAETVRFYQAMAAVSSAASDSSSASLNGHLAVNFDVGPMAENDYVGVLEVIGTTNPVDSGTILIHYNLDHFTNSGAMLLAEKDVMYWKSEDIIVHNFADYYKSATGGTIPVAGRFSKVIEIKFEDLHAHEVRRYVLPFTCPEDLNGNFEEDDPVFFQITVLNDEALSAFKTLIGSVNGAFVQVDAEYTHTGSAIVVARKATPTALIDLSYDLDPTSTFASGLASIGATFLDTLYFQDFVKNSHDPNSIQLEPDCFAPTANKATIHVEVENYGVGNASNIKILLYCDGQIIHPGTKLAVKSHSFGFRAEVPAEATYINRNDSCYYELIISNIYLPGILELGHDMGLDIIDGTLDSIYEAVLNRFGAITRGMVQFTATDLNVGVTKDSIFVSGAVYFDKNAPIIMGDSLKHTPYQCNLRPRLGNRLRLGYNYLIPFGNLNAGFGLLDNLTIGTAFDFRPHSNPLHYSLEFNYNRNSLLDNSDVMKQQNIELSLLVNYTLTNWLTVGIGATRWWQISWETSAQDLPYSYQQQKYGGLLDFRMGRDKLQIGLRGYYLPKSITLRENASEKNLFMLQAYLSYPLLSTRY